MSPRKPVPVKSPPSRTNLWAGILIVLVIAGAVLAYVRSRPGSTDSTNTEPAEFSAKHLYSETADPKAEISDALARARREHKRVILDFGGDWCIDCQVLDIYLHQAANAHLLETNFILVHVWIGQMDRNLELAQSYGVPIDRGVPALAVLAPDGTVLYAQGMGEFNKMRQMQMSSVTEFLNQWKS